MEAQANINNHSLIFMGLNTLKILLNWLFQKTYVVLKQSRLDK